MRSKLSTITARTPSKKGIHGYFDVNVADKSQLAQVPGMVFPTDPYSASSPLSRTHVPLAQRISHGAGPDYPPHPTVHNGSGPMNYMSLFDTRPNSPKFNLGVNLFFLHRGVLPPGGGIGEPADASMPGGAMRWMVRETGPCGPGPRDMPRVCGPPHR